MVEQFVYGITRFGHGCVKTAQDLIDSGAAMMKMVAFVKATKEATTGEKGAVKAS